MPFFDLVFPTNPRRRPTKLYHATGRDKMVPELLVPALAYFDKGGELPELEEAHRLLDSITAS